MKFIVYMILTVVWPANDIKSYWTVTEGSETYYKTLKDFLSNKDGQLGSFFRL